MPTAKEIEDLRNQLPVGGMYGVNWDDAVKQSTGISPQKQFEQQQAAARDAFNARTSGKRGADGQLDLDSEGVDPFEKGAPGTISPEDIANIPFIGDSTRATQAAIQAGKIRQIQVSNANQLGLPVFDKNGYQQQGQYTPEMYADPESAQYSRADESPEGRAAQMAALQQMQQATDQGYTSQAALGRYQAQQDASQFAQGREGAIRQDAMRRGQVGGAADMIMRAQAAQAGANQNLNAGLQSAQMAALQRMQGIGQQGQMAGQMRGQDQSSAYKNADIINQFNLANTSARNTVRGQNTGLRNAAQTQNLSERQRIADSNVNRGDTNAMNTYNAEAGKIDRVNGAYNGTASSGISGMLNAQTAASNNMVNGITTAAGGLAKVGGAIGAGSAGGGAAQAGASTAVGGLTKSAVPVAETVLEDI